MLSQKTNFRLTFLIIVIAIIAVGNISAAKVTKETFTPDVSLMVTPEPSNDFIQIAVRDNGTFTIGKADGTKLLYGHPNPWSSATTIRIDGENHWNFADNSIGNVISGPKVIDANSNQIVWEIGEIKLTQTLTIVEGNSGNPDTVKIHYLIVNNDTASHEIGLRTMLDTMIGGNDDAPFKLATGGELTSEDEFSGNVIPEFWEAFEDLANPESLRAQGVLTRATPRLPDRVVFGLWGDDAPVHMARVPWDYTLSEPKLSFGDSAVGIYWNPIQVAADETIEFVTYYGNGVPVQYNPQLALTFNCTNKIDRNPDNTLTPSPFAATANIKNKPDVGDATNVVATLTLGDGLELVEGDNPNNIGNLSGGDGVLRNWQVQTLDQAPYGPDNPRSISIELTCDEIEADSELDPLTISREVVVATNVNPKISVTPDAIDFGNIPVGQNVTETLTISNDSSATGELNVADITTGAEGVTIEPKTFTLAPGESKDVDVIIYLSRIVDVDGTLTIESNDVTSPTQVGISGSGVAAVIIIDPTALNFDQEFPEGVQVGQTKEATLTVGNIGNIDLEISSIASSLPDIFGRSILPSAGPVLTVPAGEEREIGVTFSPADEISYNGTLTFVSNATESSKDVNLSGTGFPAKPEIAIVEPTPTIVDDEEKLIMDFDKVELTKFNEETLTIKNIGLADLTISNFVFSNLSFSATEPDSIGPGEQVDVSVKFTPTNMGEATGTLTIQSNDDVSPEPVIDLTGFGTDVIIAVLPDPIDFGEVEVGSSASRILNIKNDGNADLEVTAINIGEVTTSAVSQIFKVDDTVAIPFTVVPGTTEQVPVIFTQQALGETYDATLTIVNNSRLNPNKTVELTGKGKEKPFEVAITSPPCGGRYNKTIQIYGTATSAEGFKQWQLYIAEGDQREWVPIQSIMPQDAAWQFLEDGTAPVSDGFLYELDTTEFDDDTYTLRLDATFSAVGDPSVERAWDLCLITIDNAPPTIHSLALTSEPGGENYTTDSAGIKITGTVSADTARVVSATLYGTTIDIPVDGIFDPAKSSVFYIIDDIGQLDSGELQLKLEVADDVGNIAEGDSNILRVDNTPPIVEILDPCFDANFQHKPIAIAGEAIDTISEVKRVKIIFDVTLEGPKRVWYPVDLQDGSWNFDFNPETFNSYAQFKVKAIDTVGNVYEQEYRRSVRYYDYRADLNISTPLDNFRYVYDLETDGEILPSVDPEPFIEIEGVAGKDPDVGYILEYAEGADATEEAKWYKIAERSAPENTYHTFTEEWHVRGLDGLYTLRLTSGGKSVKRTNIEVSLPPSIPGDVDDDEIVDENDAMLILKHVVGLYEIHELEIPVADVSGNGKVTAYDAALIIQKLRGIIPKFPVEQ